MANIGFSISRQQFMIIIFIETAHCQFSLLLPMSVCLSVCPNHEMLITPYFTFSINKRIILKFNCSSIALLTTFIS